jgi:hypothetical protein
VLHFLTKRHLISKTSLSRFTTGIETEELSNSIEESLEMKAADFH